MIYLLKNRYTEKLYNKIKMSVVNLALITLESIEQLQPDDLLVVEDIDRSLIKELDIKKENVILLGEAEDDYRVISKYQSFERIKSLLSDQFFPLYYCTSTEVIGITEPQMYEIAEKYGIEYMICLNFNQASNFSLFKWSMDNNLVLPIKEIIYVINTINDLKFEPSLEILNLIESARRKGTTMVFSFPHKGQLDFQVFEISNFLITIFKDKSKKNVLCNDQKNPKLIDVILRGEEITYSDH